MDGQFLSVDKLEKVFDGGTRAVDGVSFGVERGKILTLLGPSGCGKTTTLRCIAGLEHPTSGRISIDGEVVTDPQRGTMYPPEQRNIGMVFQSYAVWPHMTVGQNLALPLEIRKVARTEIKRRVSETLELVGLGGLEDRYANRLSGGQQQRVALARALIYHPRLLLFDEPLSNLDAKLRERMRHEIRRIQQEVGTTSVYVTHDQAEAMIISDEIIVMNRGRIEQIGDARTLYARPASAFVANFIGVANLVHGVTVGSDNGLVRMRMDGAPDTVLLATPAVGSVTGECHISIRPEDVILHRQQPDLRPNVIPGHVDTVGYLGNLIDYQVRSDGHIWRVQAHPNEVYAPGDQVYVELPPRACLCFQAEAGTVVDEEEEEAVESAASA